jgi:hypothetical protein
MSTAIKIPDTLANEAKRVAIFNKRSITKQIEYWAQIGRMVEDNPDLPYNFIKDILISLEEMKTEQAEPYKFGSE